MNIEEAINILTEYKDTGVYKCKLSELITAIDIVLKELESLQITNDLLYKTNKDLMKKQMQNIENIGTIELLGNEKWSIE